MGVKADVGTQQQQDSEGCCPGEIKDHCWNCTEKQELRAEISKRNKELGSKFASSILDPPPLPLSAACAHLLLQEYTLPPLQL